MAFYTDSFTVADLTELKALTAAQRRGGTTRVVLQPAANYAPTNYTYDETSSFTELSPIIVTPDDSQGAWISHSLLYSNTANPSAAPPLTGITWIATLTAPDRVVVYRSTGTSAVTDWLPTNNDAVVDSAAPTHNADYVGQLYYDSSADEFYLATDTAGNWQLSGASSSGGTGY